MVEKMTEEEIKQSVLQVRYLENQLSTLQQQILALERALLDVMSAIGSLESYSKIKSDSSSLLPLGGGVFADGNLSKKDTVLVDVGIGIVLEKSIEDTTNILKVRQKDLETNLNKLQNAFRNISTQHHQMSEELKEKAK